MPAIQLARLKQQCAEMADAIDEPIELMRHLHNLLDFYADRTRRPGQAGKPPPLIRAYQVSRQVLHLVEQELLPAIEQDPALAPVLMDLFWDAAWLETRLLAIAILGRSHQDDTDALLARVGVWIADCQEDQLLQALLETGMAPLRQFAPQQYLELLDNWMSSDQLASQKIALRAIPPLVSDQGFENLPYIYRLLSAHLREPALRLEAELLQAIRALARRSPQETAFFLQQGLTASRNQLTRRLIRQSQTAFPEDVGEELHALLQQDRLRGLSEG
jgi:hypothetical protein